MMSGLMDLLVLMPIIPAYVAPYLQDFFEIFSRVAAWRYQSLKVLPEVQQVHVQVGLFAFFHRLYGMFPCNFLSYLRVHYSDNNRENQARKENYCGIIESMIKISFFSGCVFPYHQTNAEHGQDASNAGDSNQGLRKECWSVETNGTSRCDCGIFSLFFGGK